MRRLIITPSTASQLDTSVDGCRHQRALLILVGLASLFCRGCGTWFNVAKVEEE